MWMLGNRLWVAIGLPAGGQQALPIHGYLVTQRAGSGGTQQLCKRHPEPLALQLGRQADIQSHEGSWLEANMVAPLLVAESH